MPLHPGRYTRRFQRLSAAAGLPQCRLHDLRHAAASMMLENGEDIAVVSKYLRHSNLSTTSDLYAHMSKKANGAAANRHAAYLAGRES